MTVGHIQHHVDIFNMCLKGGSKELVYIFQLFVYNFLNTVPALKRVLAFLTWGQVSVPEPFLSVFFQTDHPVHQNSILNIFTS